MKNLLYLLVLVLLGASLTACDDDDDGASEPAAPRVFIYHASPNAPAVDVYLNGELSGVQGLSYGNGTDGYVNLSAGDIEVAIAPAGQPVDSAVYSSTLTLEQGYSYSVFAHGILGAPGDSAFALLTLEDDLSPPTEDNARVRVLHLGHDAPDVSVVSLENLGDDTGQPVTGLTDLSYPQASAYTDLGAGDYILGLAAAGSNDVAYEMGPASFEQELHYTAIASGYFGVAPGTPGRFRVDIVENTPPTVDSP